LKCLLIAPGYCSKNQLTTEIIMEENIEQGKTILPLDTHFVY